MRGSTVALPTVVEIIQHCMWFIGEVIYQGTGYMNIILVLATT